MTATIRRTPGGKKTRDRQRLAHMAAGALLVLYVYLPGSPGTALQAATRWVILPLLVITGVSMWQWPKIRRWIRTRTSTP
ncbi:hypothetical protein WEI85_45280 [Actinomycetes bacterium KLBMP 9797]